MDWNIRCGSALLVAALVAFIIAMPASFAFAQATETSALSTSGKPAAALGTAERQAAADAMEATMSKAFRARAAAADVLQGLDGAWERSYVKLAEIDGGDAGWLWTALMVLVGAVVAGIAALKLFEQWADHRFLRNFAATPATRADQLGYLFAKSFVMLGGVLAFALVGILIVLAFDVGHPGIRVTGFQGLRAVATVLLLRVVFRGVISPDNSAYRVVGFTDREAGGLYRSLISLASIAYIVFAVCVWMFKLGLDENAHKALVMASMLFTCLALSVIAVIFSPAISRVLGRNERELPLWRRLILRLWLPLTVVYFLFAFFSSTVRTLLDLPAATGLIGAPIMALLLGFVLYGLMVFAIERWFLPRRDSAAELRVIAEDLERAATSEGEDTDPGAVASHAEAEAIEREAARAPYRALFDHAGAILAFAAALAYLLFTWGVPITDDRFVLSNLFDVLLVVFAGYLAYKAVQIAVDHRIRLEKGEEEDTGEEVEIGGKGESRLATLLPIFRNFLLITIVVIVGMIALSELGVNIAPLFAGAGVVGLAVGFGAQTLIRDIFSGAFFLIDDAFRKGEYIDIGTVKGTVEKISIRSMQLRHHRGPLNTVPFGEIQFVTNYSRDWAIMKLAFRVTYDTDVEKMRKLIKKFGQELLQHPEYGPKFLQPVKSQGVTALEDSAMIVRVKFMTRPGDQFELRKVVYAGIRDLCAREGIKFAHREVTVRVAHEDVDENEEQGGDEKALSEAEKKAIGAAVLPIVEEQAAREKSPGSADTR
ncbi:mechanosensitive ion channel family protein [Rhizobiales bacterium]|uniref:mechanosensitive ion channel family protein n=1 Tax=Hongsoonwoonella zoysiae TaxID=2821844 RepID=UPI001560C4A6|nr:mechanosensitive ion channel domain-containing protein [Hongsoonwoonella zoysiae]NRG17790.1 mechanosensitive ion channel family protein [Hongsoonwoonella zoysiae]